MAPPPDTTPLQVAYCIDGAFFEPSLVSLFSLLTHTRCPVHVHFFAPSDADIDWGRLEKLIMCFKNAILFKHVLEKEIFKDVIPKKGLSAIGYGTLLLPGHLDGRVLYIDGDTLVLSDISELRHVDLDGKLLGAVRDKGMLPFETLPRRRSYGLRHKRRKNLARKEFYLQWLDNARTATNQSDLSNYFNAGIILFDFEVIKANGRILAQMQDIAAAIKNPSFGMDQDWLNKVFHGRVKYLSARWNLFPHANHLKTKCAPAPLRHEYIKAFKNPKIVHFAGPRKPWLPWRMSQILNLSQMGSPFTLRLKYKREMRRMQKLLAHASR